MRLKSGSCLVLFIRTPNDLDKIGKYRTHLALAGPDSRVIITLLSFSAEVMNLHFTRLWEKCIDTVQFNASKTRMKHQWSHPPPYCPQAAEG